MTIILYLYLGGWISTGSIEWKKCNSHHSRVSVGECKFMASLTGAAWPSIYFVD